MKKVLSLLCLLLAACLLMTSCSAPGNTAQDNKKIVIWTSGEDYKNENYLRGLQAKFPDYEFVLEYMNSSTIAANRQQICFIPSSISSPK